MHVVAHVSVRLGVVLATVALMFATLLSSAPAAGAAPPGPSTNGFYLLGGDGGIFPFGMPFAGTQRARTGAPTTPPIAVSPTAPAGRWP